MEEPDSLRRKVVKDRPSEEEIIRVIVTEALVRHVGVKTMREGERGAAVTYMTVWPQSDRPTDVFLERYIAPLRDAREARGRGVCYLILSTCAACLRYQAHQAVVTSCFIYLFHISLLVDTPL